MHAHTWLTRTPHVCPLSGPSCYQRWVFCGKVGHGIQSVLPRVCSARRRGAVCFLPPCVPPPPVSPACETRVCVSSRAGTLTELSLFLRVSLCVSLSLCVRLLAATATHGRFSWAHSDHRTLATMHVSDTTPFSLPRCCSLCLSLCLCRRLRLRLQQKPACRWVHPPLAVSPSAPASH